MVTHHVEEIPEGITHALLIAHGQIIAAGPITQVLTDTNMTTTFGLPLKIAHHDGRWSARAYRADEANADEANQVSS